MLLFYHLPNPNLVLGDQDQTIIPNYDKDNPTLPFCEISRLNEVIQIWGAKTKSLYFSIKRKTKETDWTTVFVEWSNNDQGSFLINGKEIVGTFTCQETLPYVLKNLIISCQLIRNEEP